MRIQIHLDLNDQDDAEIFELLRHISGAPVNSKPEAANEVSVTTTASPTTSAPAENMQLEAAETDSVPIPTTQAVQELYKQIAEKPGVKELMKSYMAKHGAKRVRDLKDEQRLELSKQLETFSEAPF